MSKYLDVRPFQCLFEQYFISRFQKAPKALIQELKIQPFGWNKEIPQ